MFGLGIFDALKLGAGGLVGGALVFGYALAFMVPDARQEGREAERAAANARAIQIIQERSKTDAEVDALDSASLCRELGGEWVQSDNLCR